jgi:hypothetical protein
MAEIALREAFHSTRRNCAEAVILTGSLQDHDFCCCDTKQNRLFGMPRVTTFRMKMCHFDK